MGRGGITMKREVLPNGNIRLTSEKGIIDIRNGNIYSEVICKPEAEKYFAEAGND